MPKQRTNISAKTDSCAIDSLGTNVKTTQPTAQRRNWYIIDRFVWEVAVVMFFSQLDICGTVLVASFGCSCCQVVCTGVAEQHLSLVWPSVGHLLGVLSSLQTSIVTPYHHESAKVVKRAASISTLDAA
eukprot:1488528-Amphidinium_carterae.1